MSDKRPWPIAARSERAFDHGGPGPPLGPARRSALAGRHQDGDADSRTDESEGDGDARQQARAFFALPHDGFRRAVHASTIRAHDIAAQHARQQNRGGGTCCTHRIDDAVARVHQRAVDAAGLANAIAAAANISTPPMPSLQPKRSPRTTTPTATAIAGLTNAYSPARKAPQSRSSRR